jgi:hypothetical protein
LNFIGGIFVNWVCFFSLIGLASLVYFTMLLVGKIEKSQQAWDTLPELKDESEKTEPLLKPTIPKIKKVVIIQLIFSIIFTSLIYANLGIRSSHPEFRDSLPFIGLFTLIYYASPLLINGLKSFIKD